MANDDTVDYESIRELNIERNRRFIYEVFATDILQEKQGENIAVASIGSVVDAATLRSQRASLYEKN